MRWTIGTLNIALVGLMLTGCGGEKHVTATVQKQLTVAGPQDGVEQFAKLQGSLRPALRVSAIRALGNGRAEAQVALPASYGGEDLVHTTREALAAGLSYRFEENRSIDTVRS